MDKNEFLKKILEIKDVSLATVSLSHEPKNRIIDMMYLEDDSLYFLTAKGKEFYEELLENPHVALSVCQNRVAYTLSGVAEIADKEKMLMKLFENNPFMYELYPPESRTGLVVFRIVLWQGEYFDLNKKPIERGMFSSEKIKEKGYHIIMDKCLSCGACLSVCPSQCIDIQNKVIISSHCLHCGNCLSTCRYQAVKRD